VIEKAEKAKAKKEEKKEEELVRTTCQTPSLLL